MSLQHTVTKTVSESPASRKRSPWIGYVLSLFFTATGLVLILWSGGRGLLLALDVDAHATGVGLATLILEAVAGVLTAVFGFAMLVQATPPIDDETASAWKLPEQRTFDDEPQRMDISL